MTAPSPYSPTLPSYQLAWDSTSLGSLKTCPEYYRLTQLEGWTTRTKSIDLIFGGVYASSLEHYAHARAEGLDIQDATRVAVRHALVSTWGSDFPDADTGEPGPWLGDNIKNRATLVRSIIWNIEAFRDSPFRIHLDLLGKPMVERTFNFAFIELGGEVVTLNGHLDAVIEEDTSGDPRLWIMDDKAQPITRRVLTPKGWKRIGELKIGDKIAGRDGAFYNVIALHPKGITSTYRVIFEDKTSTLCGYDHLWTIAVGKEPWRTVPLNKLFGSERKHIPLCNPIDHPEADLPVDPYLLGALLGDGYLAGHSVAISTANEDLITKLQPCVDRMGDVLRKSPAKNLVWTITKGGGKRCNTQKGLYALELWGCKSRDKFIPAIYKFASIEQRRAILQGLLDTDGSWDRTYRRYQTMSFALAHGVADLVRSLGGWAKVYITTRDMYRVMITIGEQGLPLHKRYIERIDQVESVENVCIAVDSPDHLYITDEYIVTHNTTRNSLGAGYFERFTPDNQMSMYSVAGRIVLNRPVAGVMVRAAQIGVNFTRFEQRPILRTQAVLEEWLEDTRHYITQARQYAEANRWPHNDKACFLCAFKRVCGVAPAHRKGTLMMDFEQRPRWNPLAARGL